MSWGNTAKYKTFSFPLEKRPKKLIKMVMRVRITTILSYETEFINSARFMTSSLPNLVDNLAVGIHKTKCKDCNFFLNMKASMVI